MSGANESQESIRESLLGRAWPLIPLVAFPITLVIALIEFRAKQMSVALVIYVGAAAVATPILLVARGSRLRTASMILYFHCVAATSLFHFGPTFGTGALYMVTFVTSVALARATTAWFSWLGACVSASAVTLVYMTSPSLSPPGTIYPVAQGLWLKSIVVVTLGGAAVTTLLAMYVNELQALATRLHRALEGERREREAKERAHSALEQAERLEAIGRLAGGVAHDINNALGVILPNAEILAERIHDNDDLAPLIDDIIHASKSAAETTRQLLVIGRRVPHTPGGCDPRKVILRLSKMLRRLLPETIELQVRTEGSRNVAMAVAELEQVVVNLVLNARDAMLSGGDLRIDISDRDSGEANGVRIIVTDSGVGIDESTRLRIFDPFFTTKGSDLGSGLGLATVHSLIVSCGGTIDVESAPKRGSKFVFWLPAGEIVEPEKPDMSPTESSSGRQVLVVEDDLLVRRSIVRLLRSAGYVTEDACDGPSAIALFERSAPFELMITDAIMPRTDTPELVRLFRARFPGAPVILCSGHVQEELLRQGIAQGEVIFLQKPFEAPTLISLVRRTLAASERKTV